MPLDQALVKSAWPSCLKEQQYCGVPDKIQIYPDQDTIAQLLPVRQIKQHMFLPYDCLYF